MPAIHSLTNVVLPKPAGATTSDSLVVSPASRRSIRRDLGTRVGRGVGSSSLVLRSVTSIGGSRGFLLGCWAFKFQHVKSEPNDYSTNRVFEHDLK
jgi:hypothetical protein